MTLAFASCALLAFAAVGSAAESTAIKANVPFEFQIDDQVFPAGQYVVTYPISPVRNLILLSTPEGRALRMIFTHGFDARAWDSRTYLVFNAYGNQYFLSRIWSGALGSGRELRRSAEERNLRELLGHSAQGTKGMKVVHLAAAH
jgi:hypothetical protein